MLMSLIYRATLSCNETLGNTIDVVMMLMFVKLESESSLTTYTQCKQFVTINIWSVVRQGFFSFDKKNVSMIIITK